MRMLIYRMRSLLKAPDTVRLTTTFMAGIVVKTLLNNEVKALMSPASSVFWWTITIFVVFTAIMLACISSDISEQLNRLGLSVQVYHIERTPQGDDKLYRKLKDKVLTAEKSYRVVSLYRPSTLESSPARQDYYRTLNHLLETKVQSQDAFRYERILQVHDLEAGQITPKQVDAVTLEHCKLLLQLQELPSPVKIRLTQIPDVLRTISFVIIDEQEILIFLPTVKRTKFGSMESVQLGTGLFFEDRNGGLAQGMLDLFETLQLSSDPVLLTGEEIS